MTMFIQLQDGQPFGNAVIEDNIRALFPDRSLPVVWTPAAAAELGYGLYEFTQVPDAPRFKKAVEVLPSRAPNGIYYQTWQIVDMTEEERIAATEECSRRLRVDRNIRLMWCDWTQIPDAPLSAEARSQWSAYRQQLREVPSQQGFPWDVIWPTQPGGEN